MCLLRGGAVCSWGVSAPGGACSGGCLLLGGISALGGGVCSGGGIPTCTEADTPPLLTESQTPVKTLPCPNFVAGGNNIKCLRYNADKHSCYISAEKHLVYDSFQRQSGSQ